MKQLSYYIFREKIINLIRTFFQKQGFHEFITPVLNDSIPLEPNIFPFTTEEYYLSTSPEKNLKKMLALGIEKCFSIGHSFRNLEASGPLHSPEFLMLEWYRKNANYKDIMNDVEKLIGYIYKQIYKNHFNILKYCNRLSLVDLFNKYCRLGLKEVILSDRKLFDYAKKRGYQIKQATWSQLYDQIFVNEIESHLPKEPCFLIDFPARISPLCKPKENESHLAERFELYINGVELANGNTENTNVKSILKVFKTEQSSRTSRKSPIAPNSPIPPIDHNFLNSLKKMQNASYAGVGLGIERFVRILV